MIVDVQKRIGSRSRTFVLVILRTHRKICRAAFSRSTQCDITCRLMTQRSYGKKEGGRDGGMQGALRVTAQGRCVQQSW